ncbi:MAG: SDR family oxidoreductase [Pseudomonadota bacterium]
MSKVGYKFVGLSDFKALVTGVPEAIKTTIPNAADVPPLPPQANVLLLGSNGFVGLHVLSALTRSDRVGRVICIVRKGSTSSAARRLRNATRKNGMKVDLDAVTVLDGDIGAPCFGLPQQDYDALTSEVDVVINCAGSISHALSYRYYRKTAIALFFRLLEFSQTRKIKQMHVLGSLGSEVYHSRGDFLRFGFYHCGYSRMKWVIKQLCLQAQDRNHQVSVYLAPYVLGSQETRFRDPGLKYSFWQMVQSCYQLGYVWRDERALVPAVSGAVLADEIVSNVFAKQPKPVLFPAMQVTATEFAERFGLRSLDWHDFRKRLVRSVSVGTHIRKNGLRDLRAAIRQYLYVVALFPRDLPAMMEKAYAQPWTVDLDPSHPENSVDLLDACARANRIIEA